MKRYLCVLLCIFCCSLYGDLSQALLTHVRQCVTAHPELQHKEEALELIDALEANHSVVERGGADLRNTFVFLQGCFEHALACAQVTGDIDYLQGVIHTPTIATPLCVQPEGAIDDVLHPSIRDDEAKRLTIRSRAQIVRDYLAKGGTLYIAYPKAGEAKRSTAQLAVYRAVLAQFPKHLIDTPLACDAMDKEMIGATYLFSSSQGALCAFSIKAPQANDPNQEAEWGLWFGALEDAPVGERVQSVRSYLAEYQVDVFLGPS